MTKCFFLLQSYRKGVFAANLATINKHNEEHAAGVHTWMMGVNQLTDLTHEEFMERNKLKVPDMPQQEKKYQMQAITMADEIDWRAKVGISIIWYQYILASNIL